MAAQFSARGPSRMSPVSAWETVPGHRISQMTGNRGAEERPSPRHGAAPRSPPDKGPWAAAPESGEEVKSGFPSSVQQIPGPPAAGRHAQHRWHQGDDPGASLPQHRVPAAEDRETETLACSPHAPSLRGTWRPLPEGGMPSQVEKLSQEGWLPCSGSSTSQPPPQLSAMTQPAGGTLPAAVQLVVALEPAERQQLDPDGKERDPPGRHVREQQPL